MGGAKSMYTISRCRKHLKPWNLPAFKTEALRLYTEVCAAQAAGDRTALKQVSGGLSLVCPVSSPTAPVATHLSDGRNLFETLPPTPLCWRSWSRRQCTQR